MRLIRHLAIVLLVAFAFSVIPGASVKTQQNDRLIERLAAPREPVKIIFVKNDRVSLQIGTTFKDDEDWLKGFSLKLINTSGRAIRFVSFELLFPRLAGEAEAPISDTLEYGQESASAGETVKYFKPGDTIDLTLTESRYYQLRSFLKAQKYGDRLSRIKVRLEEVIFFDGIMWHGGMLLRRDEKNPEIWVPLKTKKTTSLNQYFALPGRSPSSLGSDWLAARFTIRDSHSREMFGFLKIPTRYSVAADEPHCDGHLIYSWSGLLPPRSRLQYQR